MIQRIQTVWLLLAAAAAFLTLKLPFYSGNIIIEGQPQQYMVLTATSNILLLILSVAVGIVALISLFMYKDRKLQLKLCFLALFISIINLVLFYMQTQKFIPGQGSINITAVIAVMIPVLLFFSIRGIYRDEKLVKGLERLR
ncbi:MAG: DUF4293 family protein [Candidatus Pseudobacter hemicellulosilyticus]|uniref:DUF4293 family protein n=1 Tax=Candidatus Pseudobacter hemicellulosilyticus TaxID=3121375 RepID=A0AAJ5WY58_9BACT|nr:MAG: DUF4293 family protein [Pseudobacter sp.]